jgi:hypothetical protein
MGFTDQGTSTQTGPVVVAEARSEDGDPSVEPATPRRPEARVNWLFSGVMLGAASWMLVLGAVFAAIGNWIVAGVLLGGVVLCGLAVWRAGRRVGRRHGRHRADGDSAAD